jgi:hypothetical protein
VRVRLYVEGGPRGANAEGLREIRKAFKQHFERIDSRLASMEVVAKGSTDQTIKGYVEGVRQFSSESAVALLVDSETPVSVGDAAKHLEAKLDSRNVPTAARKNIFLMVQCFEAWLVTDAAVLEKCFGNKLRSNALPKNPDVEAVPKADIFVALRDAIKPTPAKRYNKVRHGAQILAVLSPVRVGERASHARDLHRFLQNSVNA